MLDLSDLVDAISGDEFDEIPVSIETFVTDEHYLNLPNQPLSDLQYEMVRASTQIFKLETLQRLHGEAEGRRIYREYTFNEVIAQLGKGSGKDHTSAIACAYVVYLLLCLKSPSEYYGAPEDEPIDIINIAINAEQAKNVFFKKFTNRIKRSPWFQGRCKENANFVEFDKNIRVYSGHSEREGWEGYNTFYVVLDEISGFALDVKGGSEASTTASAIYKMYRASVTSRFAEFGKLILLSFPRFVNDFIQQRYNAVVGEKEVVKRRHTFKINEELPDGHDGNEFEIEWDEDHIVSYRSPKTWALRRPSWEVNPTKNIQDYMRDFLDDPQDALGRFACMPPMAVDAFFPDREKIESAFRTSNGLNETNRFYPDFKPKEGVKYFIHVDLAQKQDRCAVAMSHVEKFIVRQVAGHVEEPAPVVKVDLVRWWQPTKEKMVDFTEVREFILSLKRRGFDIQLVTFDRWQSADMIKTLNEYGLKAEILSVAKRHYTDMKMVVHEERLIGPNIDELIEELLALVITRQDKVDHTSKSYKDLSDAVCGSIYNAIEHTPRNDTHELEVYTAKTLANRTKKTNYINDPNAINDRKKGPGKETMDVSLAEYLALMRVVGKG